MTTPVAITWAAPAFVVAHTALLTALAGGTVKVRNAADVLLASVTLASPAGTVHGTTGQITLTTAVGTASAAGTAAYGELCNSAGAVLCAMPCATGTSAAPGYLALNTLTLLAGGAVTITGTIG